MKKTQAKHRSEGPGTGENKINKASRFGNLLKVIRKHVRFKRTKTTTTTTEFIVE